MSIIFRKKIEFDYEVGIIDVRTGSIRLSDRVSIEYVFAQVVRTGMGNSFFL
jgi:hypothetical protein